MFGNITVEDRRVTTRIVINNVQKECCDYGWWIRNPPYSSAEIAVIWDAELRWRLRQEFENSQRPWTSPRHGERKYCYSSTKCTGWKWSAYIRDWVMTIDTEKSQPKNVGGHLDGWWWGLMKEMTTPLVGIWMVVEARAKGWPRQATNCPHLLIVWRSLREITGINDVRWRIYRTNLD